jgi:hypothetical protein
MAPLPEPTEELKAELDRRLAEDDAAPADGVPWEEVLAEAEARLKDRATCNPESPGAPGV